MFLSYKGLRATSRASKNFRSSVEIEKTIEFTQIRERFIGHKVRPFLKWPESQPRAIRYGITFAFHKMELYIRRHAFCRLLFIKGG